MQIIAVVGDVLVFDGVGLFVLLAWELCVLGKLSADFVPFIFLHLGDFLQIIVIFVGELDLLDGTT